jgi:hypothetical protein
MSLKCDTLTRKFVGDGPQSIDDHGLAEVEAPQ